MASLNHLANGAHMSSSQYSATDTKHLTCADRVHGAHANLEEEKMPLGLATNIEITDEFDEKDLKLSVYQNNQA